MGRELYDTFPGARGVYEQVSKSTGIDVAALCFETDEDTLRETQNAQLALYACGLAAWAALSAHTDVRRFVAVAGHSVGEYAALAAAGVLSVEDGAKLVQIRGRLMSESGAKYPGTMAAILMMERADLEQVCAEAGGLVVVANDNCPGQLILSGEVEAVDRAVKLAADRRGKMRPMNVAGAFHSPLMRDAAAEMGRALLQFTFKDGDRAVYSNVTSERVVPSILWPDLLENQLYSPVRWTESIQHMLRDGIDTFVECGVGKVLTSFLPRIDKAAIGLRVVDQASLQEALEGIGASRSDGELE